MALFIFDSLFGQIPAEALRSISLIEVFLKNQLDDFRFIRVYNKVSYILIPFVRAALMLSNR